MEKEKLQTKKPVLQIQILKNILQRHLCETDSSISDAIINLHFSIFVEQAAAEYDVSEEALNFIIGLGLEDRLFQPCNYLPGLVTVQQDGTKTITVVSVGAVIDFEPALFGFKRDGTGADFYAVPKVRLRSHQAAVATPAEKVG